MEQLNIFRFLFAELLKVKWLLVLTIVLSGVLGFWHTMSPNTPHEYQATVSLIVPNILTARAVTSVANDLKGLGVATNNDLECVKSALLSRDAFTYLDKYFNFLKRYRLDKITDQRTQEKFLMERYQSSISVKITKKAVVKITMFDESPTDAKAMVDSLAQYADYFVEKMVKRKASIATLRQTIDSLNYQRLILLDSLEAKRKTLKMYRVDKMSNLLSQNQALLFTQIPEFHQYYDKMISNENQVRDLQGFIQPLNAELIRREENIKSHPHLVQTMGYSAVFPVITRPKQWQYMILSSISGLLMFCGFYSISVIIKYKRVEVG